MQTLYSITKVLEHQHYINFRSIRIATKQKDEEAKRLAVLIADLLLNQEDDLVEYEAINNNNKDEQEVLEVFFDKVINLALAQIYILILSVQLPWRPRWTVHRPIRLILTNQKLPFQDQFQYSLQKTSKQPFLQHK